LFRKPSSLHLPLLALIAFDVFFGQVLLLRHLSNLQPGEWGILCLTAFAHGLFFLLTISFVLAVLTACCASCVSSWIWAFAATVSNAFWIDSFGYQWLDLHLDDTASLLLWNLRGDFLVMKSKLLFVCAGALLLIVSFWALAFFYRATAGRFRWAVHPVSMPRLGLGLLASILFFVPLHYLVNHRVSDISQYQFAQAEWPADVLAPQRRSLLTVARPTFLQLPSESLIEARLQQLKTVRLARRPNIFLFVVESLRADAISAETTPNLFQLRLESLPILDGEANANCTHIAWFSLFNSSSPLFWSSLAKAHEHRGALPFRLLKAVDYKVFIFATPNLHYYNADHAFFSDSLSLADVIVDQSNLTSEATRAEPADLDRAVMTRVVGSLESLKPESAHFFAIFLDAPHHDYSWPKDFPPRYTPYMETVSLLKTHYDSAELELLKNRYLNSVYFVDSLIGEFLKELKTKGLSQDSIIVVVGDHGEEFMERGHLTHSSELNHFQTSIPVIFFVPELFRSPGPQLDIQVASQVDIFPTLFDLLGVETTVGPLLAGASLLRDKPPRFALSARCTSFSPKQVVVLNGVKKILVEFDGIASTNLTRELYARRLRVVDLLDSHDRSLASSKQSAQDLRHEVQSEFGDALRQILKTP
jgi:glucan phosphoethanolaminetransferase (alkaline phosphatase superfamily)